MSASARAAASTAAEQSACASSKSRVPIPSLPARDSLMLTKKPPNGRGEMLASKSRLASAGATNARRFRCCSTRAETSPSAGHSSAPGKRDQLSALGSAPQASSGKAKLTAPSRSQCLGGRAFIALRIKGGAASQAIVNPRASVDAECAPPSRTRANLSRRWLNVVDPIARGARRVPGRLVGAGIALAFSFDERLRPRRGRPRRWRRRLGSTGAGRAR